MATVFLAWDSKLKVWRAIKVLLPAYVSKKKLRKRFENEAHAMARLEHVNIVRIYDVGVEGKVPYMVMELAEGGCVIDWLDRYGAMPPRLAIQVMLELCAGIQSAHEAGIVHRDIKPHNLLVTRNGVCKVTDFGIAQVMDQDALTKTGSVMGTWGFMAPEQRVDSKGVDERADVFALGATFYNLLTNRPPTELYVADEDDEMFEGIAPDLLAIIIKACSYKAHNRQDNVLQLRAELEAVLPDQPPIPPNTPSLVLTSETLPDSVESAHFSPTIVQELEDALGPMDGDDEPSDLYHPAPHAAGTQAATPVTSAPGRVLPYYMPQARPNPSPSVPRPLGGIPSYLDAAEVERERSTHSLPTPAAPDPTPTLPPPVVSEPPPSSELWVRVVAVGLIGVIGLLVLLGWGMVSVNGAEGAFLDAQRGVEATMAIEKQGPVIDGLGLAGADKAAIEAAHQRYTEASRGERLEAAHAYLSLVQRTSQDLGNGPTVDKLRPVIAELEGSYDHAAQARDEWREIAQGFPGSLAVTVGLALTP